MGGPHVFHFLGSPEVRPAWADCSECSAYWSANASAVIHAAASVGIERGLTTNQSIDAYFRERHKAHTASDAA